VLRCGGCGAVVSDFAARCPSCRKSTNDAQAIPPQASDDREDGAPNAPNAPDAPQPMEPPPKPEQDTVEDVPAYGEPDHRPGLPGVEGPGVDGPVARFLPLGRRRRTAVTVATLAVVGAAVGLGATAAAKHGSTSTAAVLAGLKLKGQVVSNAPNGTVVLTRPDGSHPVALPSLGTNGPAEPTTLTPSLDGRYLATSQGDVISVLGWKLDRTAAPALFPAGATAQADAFADDDQALVILTPGPDSPVSGQVSVVSLATHRVIALGAAADAAGDPQSLGAFVSVAELPQPPGAGTGAGADVRIELVRADEPPLLLATAAQLDADLHQAADQPTSLAVFPDPTGNKIAVVVNPLDAGNSDAGIVVLDRGGRVLGVDQPALGPVQETQPAWSPDGKSLAYYMFGEKGGEIGVWKVGGRVFVRTAPDRGDSFLTCVWSPDGRDILCPAFFGTTNQSTLWVLGSSTRGPLVEVPAPGVPEAWVAGQS